MAGGDYYTIACLAMHGKAARKTQVRSPQEPDITQHTSGQKLVFTKSHDSNNVSIAKEAGPSLDSGFGLLASSTRTRPTQRSAPGGGVGRLELEINVAPCIAGGREA